MFGKKKKKKDTASTRVVKAQGDLASALSEHWWLWRHHYLAAKLRQVEARREDS